MNISFIEQVNEKVQYLIIPFYQNEKLEDELAKISRKHQLSQELLNNDFKAQSGDYVSTYVKKKGVSYRLVLLGLGNDKSQLALKVLLNAFVIKNRKKFTNQIQIDVSRLLKRDQGILVQLFTNAFITGSYDLGLYKTDRSDAEDIELVYVSKNDWEGAAHSAKEVSETQIRVMDLVNAPANKLTPTDLGNWTIASGKQFGYNVKVLSKQEIIDEGLNSVLAVNQGSDQDPAFIIAEYRSEQAERHYGVVGKGVTFDTGGLSIKGSANMHYMKSDMGGAAAALGAIEAVARLELPINLTVIVPSVENSVDATAQKPGDIIHSHSGKTIEVIDTDAEGRLILADGLSYITKNYQTDVLIDFATLTGSVIATLGFHAAGMFTNDLGLKDSLLNAGEDVGERLWPLPLWKEYEEDLESDVADVKNYSGKPLAGAITAAKFLEVFVNDHPHWCHMDIAGMAFKDSPLGKQKHATAFGVSLMVEYFSKQ